MKKHSYCLRKGRQIVIKCLRNGDRFSSRVSRIAQCRKEAVGAGIDDTRGTRGVNSDDNCGVRGSRRRGRIAFRLSLAPRKTERETRGKKRKAHALRESEYAASLG